MADVTKLIKRVSSQKKKIEKEMEALLKSYVDLNSLLKNKFKDEIAYNGSLEGLGMFNALNMTVSKNLSSVGNAHYLLKKLRDLSVFSVSEIEEEVISGDLSKLMK